MNRRDALKSAGAGLVATAVGTSTAGGSPRPGLWVPVARADVRSVNGNRYPAAVLAGAAGRLGSCPVHLGYGGQTVGRVAAWRFRGGWLEASVEVSPAAESMIDSGRKVVRPGWLADDFRQDHWVWCEHRRGTPDEWRPGYTVGSILSVVEVALLDPDDAAWSDVGGPV